MFIVGRSDLRFEAAFFESVPVVVMRPSNQGAGKKISLPEMNVYLNGMLTNKELIAIHKKMTYNLQEAESLMVAEEP